MNSDADEQVDSETPHRWLAATLSHAALLIIGGILGFVLAEVRDSLNVSRDAFDRNDDGRVDEIIVHREGVVVRLSQDRNFDGEFDAHYDYAADGTTTSAEQDDNFDGTPDTFITYRFNQHFRTERDSNGDGNFDIVEEAEHGVPRRQTLLDLNTGKPRVVYDYGPFKLRSAAYDTDGDGAFDDRVEYDEYEMPVPAVR